MSSVESRLTEKIGFVVVSRYGASPSDKSGMPFDAVVTNPGRLRILTALAVEERQEFVHLRRTTQLTDGNLAAHARRLESAGLVAIDKKFRDGKPVTSFALTHAGRSALEQHVRRVMAAISHRRMAPMASEVVTPSAEDISLDNSLESASDMDRVAVAVGEDDEWVD